MTDLARIRQAQVRAAEELICSELEDKGLAPASSLTLDANEVEFLGARLRRLFAHFKVAVPDGGDDARLIGNAAAGIGLLLTAQPGSAQTVRCGHCKRDVEKLCDNVCFCLNASLTDAGLDENGVPLGEGLVIGGAPDAGVFGPHGEQR